MDRANAEKEKEMINNTKKRHPNLIQKLNDKFRAVSNINLRDKSSNNGPPVRRNLFGNSRRLRRQRRQRKTRRQRK
jgi:hypothetical protein